MSKTIGHLGLVALTLALLSSCLDTDYGDVTLHDDIAITNFYISTANMINHTTSSTGEDSTYVTTGHSMSGYPFYIDQLRGEIYNVDSLPLGTDVTKLLCGYSTKNNAIVYIFNLAGDSLRLLQTTDSTDFTEERRLWAVASDGQSWREYKVRVAVHQEDGDEFQWSLRATDATLASLSGMSLVELGGQMLLFGSDGDSTRVYATAYDDGSQWQATGAALGADAYRSVAQQGDSLFVLDGGKLYVTTDGTQLREHSEAAGIERIVGAGGGKLFGLSDDGALMAWDEAGGWQADASDIPMWLTPTQDVACCTSSYAYADSTDYVLLVGSRDAEAYPEDTISVVWRKVAEMTESSNESKWVVVETDGYNNYLLPRLSSMALLAYGDVKLAFGMAGIGACDETAFERIYVSRDQGITWKQDSSYAFPDDFDTEATAFAAAVDSQNHIWIVCAGSGQVWRGRLNSMGWAN